MAILAHQLNDWKLTEIWWECGGMTLIASALHIEPPSIDEINYPVPDQLLRGVDENGWEWLIWSEQRVGMEELLRTRRSPRAGKCLERFLHLADASLEELEAFAAAWGPVGVLDAVLDNHSDVPHLVFNRDHRVVRDGGPAGFVLGGHREPVHAWRLLAKEANAILAVAARVALGERVPDIPRPAPVSRPAVHSGPLVSDIPFELDYSQYILAVRRWMDRGGMRVCDVWPPGTKHLTLRVHIDPQAGLAGVLALELSAILSNPTGIYKCDGCSALYSTRRRPRADRRRYCDECSQGSSKAAKREWWSRNRPRSRRTASETEGQDG